MPTAGSRTCGSRIRWISRRRCWSIRGTVRFEERFVNSSMLSPRSSRSRREEPLAALRQRRLIVDGHGLACEHLGRSKRSSDHLNLSLACPHAPRSRHRRAVVAVQPAQRHRARPLHQPVLAHRRKSRLRRDRSMHVRARLLASGFSAKQDRARCPRAPPPGLRSIPTEGKAGATRPGTLAVARAGEPDEVVLSRDKQHICPVHQLLFHA